MRGEERELGAGQPDAVTAKVPLTVSTKVALLALVKVGAVAAMLMADMESQALPLAAC